jgi:hypothetical protein
MHDFELQKNHLKLIVWFMSYEKVDAEPKTVHLKSRFTLMKRVGAA